MKKRTPKTPPVLLADLDLSLELPTEHAVINVRREVPVTRLGHNMVLTGEAHQLEGLLHLDIPAIAQRLGVLGAAEDLSNLSVVVHGADDGYKGSHTRGKIDDDVHGWHLHGQRLAVDSAQGYEFLPGPILHAATTVPAMRQVLWHEAGHVYNNLMNRQGRVLYTPQRIARLGRAGVVAAGEGVLLAMTAAVVDTAPTAPRIAAMAVGGALLGAGVKAAKDPSRLLWLASSEERRANRFAASCADIPLVIDQPHPAVSTLLVERLSSAPGNGTL